MIIEINDIANNQKAFGHVQPLPDGVGLGKLFQKYDTDKIPDLSGLLPSIVQVSVNGKRIDNWQAYHPGPNDRVNFVIGPRVADWIYYAYMAVMIISALISIAQFVMGLFASPPTMGGRRKESDTYAFDGIRDTYQLGSPIGVTYGEHRKGGQVLMYYLSMMPGNKGTKMHMLLSLGEGPVESITDIELNDMTISEIESASAEMRLGTSSQAILAGFEQIKNTFYDGREITDKQKNGLSVANCSHVVYRTSAYDVEAIEYFICAPNGCYKSSNTGAFKMNWSKYVVEFRRSASASLSAADAPWTTWDTRQLTGKDPIPTWDFGQVTFPRPGQYDIKFTWRGAKAQKPVGRCTYAIQLMDVTEIRGPSQTFSYEALLAINAAPTAQLHGGQPNVTAMVKGLQPRVYRTVSSYAEEWTNNPAWSMVDWMTNSRYGMGADIPIGDIDIQSFLDFASLAESLAETCTQSISENNCPAFGTANFFDGTLAIDSKSPTETVLPSEFRLHSKYAGTVQNGLIYCRPCCPPDNLWGVNSSDFLNSYLDASLYLRTALSGTPIFGITCYVRSGTNQFSGTLYGLLMNTVSSNILLCRWNGTSPATYGTILQTYSFGVPASGDWFDLTIDQNYDLPSSYGGSNLIILTQAWRAATDTYIVDTQYVDSSALRIPHTVLDRSLGVIGLPVDQTGDYHSANIYEFYGQTGLCYGPIGHLGSHELTCVQAIPYYNL